MPSSPSAVHTRDRCPNMYRELPPASYTTAREPLEFTTGFSMLTCWLMYRVPLPE